MALNTMQQRHIIGKVLSKDFSSERMTRLVLLAQRLRNMADGLKLYTEADHRSEDEKDKCLRCISEESDEMVKIIDEVAAEWQN